MTILHMMLCVAMTLGAPAQNWYAGEWAKKSLLTTDRPVEVPGMVLEPGVYVVKLQSSTEKRSVVQILTQDESRLLASVVAVPDHRMRAHDMVFRYYEVTDGSPRPLQSWYYPGDLDGLEFVYPTRRAQEIARSTDCAVMASGGGEDLILAITPNGKEVVVIDQTRQKPGL
jgi:hypothetical protein